MSSEVWRSRRCCRFISTASTKATPRSSARCSFASHLYAAGGDGKASDWPRGEWFKMVEGRPSGKAKGSARADRIVSIDFSGPTTAIAKVECQLPPRYFTDYLTLLKVDGRWQIISKTFHTVTKE